MDCFEHKYGRGVAQTTAALGQWGFKRCDAQGKAYACVRAFDTQEPALVNRWEELHWASGDPPDMDGLSVRAEQEQLPIDLGRHIVLKLPALGQGGYGMAFQCKIRVGNKTWKDCVLKIPVDLLKERIVQVSSNIGYLTQADGDHAKRKARDIAMLRKEFENFSRIYEPELLQRRSKQSVVRVTVEELTELQAEVKKMELAGRRYIHEYRHFDASIPAIISVKCENTIYHLRANRPELFAAHGYEQMSHCWMQVGAQIFAGIEYMKSRKMVHTDIKPDNVLYVGNPNTDGDDFTCKISDFGLCQEDRVIKSEQVLMTTYYKMPNWPKESVSVEPINACLYGWALTMAELLAIADEREIWPRWRNDALKEYLLQDMQAIERMNAMLFRTYFPNPVTTYYVRQSPSWGEIMVILRLEVPRTAGDPRMWEKVLPDIHKGFASKGERKRTSGHSVIVDLT